MSLGRLLRQVADDDWIGPVLDRAGAIVRPEGWFKPSLYIHPSGAGGTCVREIELGMLGHRPPVDKKSARRMLNGTLAHDRWTEEFRRAGLLVEANVRLRLESPPWSGECDLIARRPGTVRDHLVEIKTMNAQRFRRVPAQDANPVTMMRRLFLTERKYVLQLTQYISRFAPVRGTQAGGAFLFEDTDSQDYKLRYVQPDQGLLDEAFRLPVLAQAWAARGELVEPPFARTSPTCRSCYRRRVCLALQDGDATDTRFAREALETLRSATTEQREEMASAPDDEDLLDL